ncbi:cytochrome P450 4C1 [Nephila pilipes]|uniref:Cytochrome P450 4C1 n=1 Tax=Nephila pilipes TaxID=299642 RepID=A0A8X6NPR0_NEPPI|nr:cytochrome P450 4C1 [Nephila pilipes]
MQDNRPLYVVCISETLSKTFPLSLNSFFKKKKALQRSFREEEKRNSWRMGLHTILIVGVFMILMRMPTFLKILKKTVFLQRCTIPTFDCMNLPFYLSGLLSIYRQSRPDVPAFCLILQAIFGYIRVVIKEKIFCLYIFFKPFVLFYKPETAEVVLSSTKLIDRSKEYELLSQCIGKGLFIGSGTIWRNRRKLLTPAFHFSILKEFLPIFQEKSSVLVSKLQALTREPWIDIAPLMSACALDIICETAMGVSVNALDGQNIEYLKAVHVYGIAVNFQAEEQLKYRAQCSGKITLYHLQSNLELHQKVKTSMSDDENVLHLMKRVADHQGYDVEEDWTAKV